MTLVDSHSNAINLSQETPVGENYTHNPRYEKMNQAFLVFNTGRLTTKSELKPRDTASENDDFQLEFLSVHKITPLYSAVLSSSPVFLLFVLRFGSHHFELKLPFNL